jgi:hypothetical protein
MKRVIATLAMAAAAAGGIALAPVAAAAPTGVTSTNTGNATVVQSPGNVQVTAQPGAAAVQAGPLQYPVFGYGVPGIAFHHSHHNRR